MASLTGRYEEIIKGFKSWAKALRLIEGNKLTPLACTLIDLDPSFAQTLTRSICYIELVANPHAEVAAHVCREILPQYALHKQAIKTKDVSSDLINSGIGTNSRSAEQPHRDAGQLLSALSAFRGFGNVGILHKVAPGHYQVGQSNQGALITSYAIRQWWPQGTTYLKREEVFHVVAPLLLPRAAFHKHLSELERRGQVIRITSSGLDQVRPIWSVRIEDILTQLPGEVCWAH